MAYLLTKTEDYNSYVINHFVIESDSDFDSIISDYTDTLHAGWEAIQLIENNVKKYLLGNDNIFYEVNKGQSPVPYDVETFVDVNLISINNGIANTNIKNLSIAVSSAQTLPTTITLRHQGKNWFNKKPSLANSFLDQNIDTSTGQPTGTASTDYMCTVDYIEVVPNTTYTLSINFTSTTSVTSRIYQYDNNKNYLGSEYSYYSQTGQLQYITFTTKDNCSYIKFRCRRVNDTNYIDTEFQLEVGDTITKYSNYTYNDYDVVVESLNTDINISDTVVEYDGSNNLFILPQPELSSTISAQLYVDNSIPRLPSEYQEVESITCTGTQYIMTDVFPAYTYGIDIDFSTDSIEDGHAYRLFGSRVASNNKAFISGKTGLNDNKLFAQFSNATQTKISDVYCVANKKTNIKLSKNGFYVDDVLYKTFSSYSNFVSDLAVALFGYNNNGVVTAADQNVTIYYCKFYRSNTCIRNIIPCYRKSDNVIGMYDTVFGAFYTNSGTGEFLKGKDIIY